MTSIQIFTFDKNPELRNKTAALSEKYSFTFFQPEDWSQIEDEGFYLEVSPELVTLHNVSLQGRLSVTADFFSGELQHRVKTFSKKQSLAKAVFANHKNNNSLRVIDATGGFGRDAACLASLGIDVTIYERNPVVFNLLSAGLESAEKNSQFSKIFKGKLGCVFADSHEILQEKNCSADVIYLDPMYPERKKKSLSRKNMQILQDLVGSDPDREKLLGVAMGAGAGRVVVKRPPDIEPLFADKVTLSFNDKLACFDVYVL
ncbi:MAG: class I SAM-dependent methyltransferase [Planctomycetota bacterium]|jgi:16S rRNA (guanine1516-N2)-methyltransferase